MMNFTAGSFPAQAGGRSKTMSLGTAHFCRENRTGTENTRHSQEGDIVAQTMGAAGWHVDPDRFQAHSDHCRDACRGQWADGSIDGQKDLSVAAASSVSKITDD